MVRCNTCNVDLTENNWATSRRVRNHKLCNSCKSESNAKTNPNNNPKNNPNRLYINGKYIPKKDPRYKVFKPGNYKNINDAVFEQSTISSIKEGYVYVITNKAWPDWVKIGMAIEAEDRLSGYQTSSPHRDYVLEHCVYVGDRRISEQKAHDKATLLALETNGEWFKLTVEQAITILDNLDEQHRTPSKADTHPPKDNVQKRPIQADFWDIAEDFQSS